ncbi:PAT complex subunit Asterix isoform X2 [Myiozetetes cayanensis]|uniref:PAT complex subunit Asterix isoform X2 n=1 Tax=Myiozetetes cayanensis TaxID=478635 RepID=UPI00215ED5C0|nr:PAT complex subunit Asterix isoform X2 [Myiozetetes cayanensis]
MADPRRPGKVARYKPPATETNPALEDPTPDYMNLLGMVFSMCGLMLKGFRGVSKEVSRGSPAQVVRLDRCVLLLHQLRQLPQL